MFSASKDSTIFVWLSPGVVRRFHTVAVGASMIACTGMVVFSNDFMLGFGLALIFTLQRS